MYKGHRGVDNNFKAWHKLYRRCEREDIQGERLLAARIPYANTSVNWSKYSNPWDVIFDYPNFGFTGLFVHDLPTELPNERTDGSKLHSFVAEHFPDENNYSHCHITTHKEGEKVDGQKLPAIVKKEFRTIISDRSVLLLAPKI